MSYRKGSSRAELLALATLARACGASGDAFPRRRRLSPDAARHRPPAGRGKRGRGRIAAMATTTLITVAPTGAESAKADVPALPVTLDELVTAARECEAIGASVIHVHIRDDAARPTLDPALLRDTVAALREANDLIVQLSTVGALTDSD